MAMPRYQRSFLIFFLSIDVTLRAILHLQSYADKIAPIFSSQKFHQIHIECFSRRLKQNLKYVPLFFNT